ncbi:MAG: cytochrome C, partial [Candidatus Marinimicrobia bacterium]|nr:cytochrome C [Candidatus Neomarinimicrobiota bacterium]
MKQTDLAAGLVLTLLLSIQAMATTADHTKFEILQQEFASGPEVTKACLSCHTEASMQIHKTKHWTWDVTSHQDQNLGKRHVINNFCVGVQ